MEFIANKTGADETIIACFRQSFTDAEGEAEGSSIAQLVGQLLSKRDDVGLRVFTAEDDGKVIGAVCYTPLWFDEHPIRPMLLSPMAVATDAQGKGVGQALIKFAHAALKEEGIPFVLTYGDINFYGKTGFQQISVDLVPAPLPLSYPEGWMAAPLGVREIPKIEGKAFCVEPFNDAALW